MTLKKAIRPLIIILIFFSLIIIAGGQNNSSSNKKKWVYDNENILTDEQELVLDSIIVDYEEHTTNEIIIVTVADIGDSESMADYAVDLGNKWGVGKKNKDNGLVILCSKNLKKVQLSTGLGTEKILTDDMCKDIIDVSMIPYFKQGNFYEGLKSGLEDCIKRWK
jgi:uncharacterized protein